MIAVVFFCDFLDLSSGTYSDDFCVLFQCLVHGSDGFFGVSRIGIDDNEGVTIDSLRDMIVFGDLDHCRKMTVYIITDDTCSYP